jgi:pyrroline-5-carboxylate reductase
MAETATVASDSTPRVAFIGAGKMASALALGLIRAGFTSADRIVGSDVSAESRDHFATTTGAATTISNIDAAKPADIVVLAVKPHHLKAVLTELNHHLGTRHLIVSIVAGVSIESMCAILGHDRRIVRVMPNTPCLVGESASAYCVGGTATPADGELIARMLTAVGIALPVAEQLIDAVTGLSGSGPAYVFLIIEALSDGGVKMGLPRDVATRLAAQTLLGAAKMVVETKQHPGVLKDAVASPGGTTIAGLHALEQGGLRGTLMNAVEAATRRARELG